MATSTLPRVGVDEQGFVTLNQFRITPREAVEFATDLAQAVEDSIWRDQMGTGYYSRTENILHRANAPLGQALTALRKVFR